MTDDRSGRSRAGGIAASAQSQGTLRHLALASGLMAAIALAACTSTGGPPATAAEATAPPTAAGLPAPTAPTEAPADDVPLIADAPPSGLEIELVAWQLPGKDVSFDLVELEAPAGKSFEVKLDNQDARYKHDFALVPEGGYASAIFFKGDVLEPGEATTMTVPGLEAGTYEFVCSLHSMGMRGLIVVR